MKITMAFIVFLFGGIIGSFLNVCIYRIPRHISIVFPSSFCPECKNPVPVIYNVPIIGYITLLGKCKFCGKKISIRYPIVELLTALSAVFCFFYFPLLPAIANFLFISTLIVISFIDLDFQIIPDVISLPAIFIGAIASYLIFHRPLFSIVIAVIAGGGIFFIIGKAYEIIAKREGLGGGDVKLMAFFGAYLGVRALPFIILVSSLTGMIAGIYLMIAKGKDTKYALPFGPFLAFAAILYLFAGDSIINWYLSLLMR